MHIFLILKIINDVKLRIILQIAHFFRLFDNGFIILIEINVNSGKRQIMSALRVRGFNGQDKWAADSLTNKANKGDSGIKRKTIKRSPVTPGEILRLDWKIKIIIKTKGSFVIEIATDLASHSRR